MGMNRYIVIQVNICQSKMSHGNTRYQTKRKKMVFNHSFRLINKSWSSFERKLVKIHFPLNFVTNEDKICNGFRGNRSSFSLYSIKFTIESNLYFVCLYVMFHHSFFRTQFLRQAHKKHEIGDHKREHFIQ